MGVVSIIILVLDIAILIMQIAILILTVQVDKKYEQKIRELEARIDRLELPTCTSGYLSIEDDEELADVSYCYSSEEGD